MKYTPPLILLLLVLLCHVASSFVPSQHLSRSPQHPQVKIIVQASKNVDDIAHELEDLGEEISDQVMRNDIVHGFDEIHESDVHKLKKKVRDLKHQWQEDRKHLQAMEKRIHHLEEALIQTEAKMLTEENLLLNDIYEHQRKEDESILKLLGKVIRLAGRRTKNGIKRVFRFTHKFP